MSSEIDKIGSGEDLAALKIEIGERLRAFSETVFDSHAALARALDLHPQSLHTNYLKGKNLPGAMLLIKLHHLGCDIVWLLTGEGLPPDATARQAEHWLQSCRSRAARVVSRSELERTAIEEMVENMRKIDALRDRT